MNQIRITIDSQRDLIKRQQGLLAQLETILKIQGDLIKEQGTLIDQLTRDRNEAMANLKTASAQWEIWRKQSGGFQTV